jgi:hypothetical protein
MNTTNSWLVLTAGAYGETTDLLPLTGTEQWLPRSSVRSLLALLSPAPTQFFQELSIRYYALRTKEGSLEQ